MLGVEIVSVCEEAGGQLAQPADGDVAQPHKDTVRGGEGGGVVTEEGLQGRKAGRGGGRRGGKGAQARRGRKGRRDWERCF